MRDPGNDVLIEQSFLMELDRGQLGARRGAGARPVKAQPTHRTAHAFMGLVEFKAQRYAAADEHFKAASGNPIGELTSTLARAWVYRGAGQDPGGAGRLLDAPKQPGLGAVLSALSSGAARRRRPAAAPRRAPPTSASPRTTSARCASRLPTRGMPPTAAITKLAQSILKAHFEKTKSDGHPVARRCRTRSKPASAPTCSSPRPPQGLAEAFYGLGEALTGEGGVGVGRGLPAVRALSRSRLSVRAGHARQRLRDDQALRGRHRRLRPHPQGYAAAGRASRSARP